MTFNKEKNADFIISLEIINDYLVLKIVLKIFKS
jgi:hypothetical protein